MRLGTQKFRPPLSSSWTTGPPAQIPARARWIWPPAPHLMQVLMSLAPRRSVQLSQARYILQRRIGSLRRSRGALRPRPVFLNAGFVSPISSNLLAGAARKSSSSPTAALLVAWLTPSKSISPCARVGNKSFGKQSLSGCAPSPILNVS